MFDKTNLEYALAYARRGLAVFPLLPNSKKPYPRSHGVKDATSVPKVLRSRWRAAASNVAVATGEVSGIWVLDVDPRHAGHETLNALTREHGPLPTTVKVSTPSGGKHYWFKYPPDRRVPCSAGQIGPGLDVRGDGGYVVAPPSSIDGVAYAFPPDPKRYKRGEMKKGAICLAPAWLLSMVGKGPTSSGRKYAEPLPDVVTEGGRNVALTSLAGTLRDRDCLESTIRLALLNENANRFKPPLDEREVDKIVKSVMRYPPGRAWYAASDAEDDLADQWLASQDKAIARWAGAR